MSRLLRALLIGGTALLSACVLHSKAPLFADAEASLVLGAAPLSLTVTQADRSAWVKPPAAQVVFTPQGRHYRTAYGTIAFVPLGQGQYVAQYSVADGSDYAIATWDGRNLQLRPLNCARLKPSRHGNPVLTFVTRTCELRPDAPPLATLATLAPLAADANLILSRP